MTPCITAISSHICASTASSRPGAGFDSASFGCCRNRMCKHDPGCGTGKGAIHCPNCCGKKDGRAEIDAHAAEWLKESDVPSVAVAFIKDRRLAWTAVYGEQSPVSPRQEKRYTTWRRSQSR